MSFLTSWRSRRDDADVRVHPDTHTIPAPPKHRAPARNGAAAIRSIKAEAPTTPTRPKPGAVVFDAFALEWMDQDIDRMLAAAADKEHHANQLLGEATRLRVAAANWKQLRRLGDAVAALDARGVVGPQVPLGDRQGPARPFVRSAGPCFGCDRVEDTVPCWNQLEGRHVPLCPRCHPSADITDDYDPDEPERVDPVPDGVCCARAANGGLCPECGGLRSTAPDAPAEAPEPLTPAPPQSAGPAAVPQFQPRGWQDTEELLIGWFRSPTDGDTRDLAAVDGAL